MFKYSINILDGVSVHAMEHASDHGPVLRLCNSCTHSRCPLLFLDTEESCVSYCREWKMPFTLWYGRSGSTGSISSARKKRRRDVSSLKSVLWCERGKCMQLCPNSSGCMCVVCRLCGEGNRRRRAWWDLWLHGFLELTCWFVLGLWWCSNWTVWLIFFN